ncbi:response regulator [Roseimaritima ulvae]|nr:response regulator [Roseimaritima ulvae]
MLLEHLEQPVWIASADASRLLYINPPCRRLLGAAADAVDSGTPWWRQWVPVHEQSQMQRAIDRCRVDEPLTVRLTQGSGSDAATLDLTLIRDPSGELAAIVQPSANIMPRNWSHPGTFRNLLDSLPLALVVKNLRGERIFVNRFYLDLHKIRADAVLGKTDFQLFPADIAEQFTADDRFVIDNEQVVQSTEQLPLNDGRMRWIERIKGPARDVEGNIIGVQLLFWDVTERKRIEAELDEERYLLHSLLDNLPDAIYFKDRESRFRRVSMGMAKKFGWASPSDAIGKTDADVFTSEHADQAREDELRIMETRIPIVARIEKETWPDRDDTWCSSTKLPLCDGKGQVVGTFGMSRDITDLKRIEFQLREARDAADAANAAKSQFLANMSHEIRTPMNGILGMAELLTKTSLDQRQADYVGLIQQSGQSLLRLLNDILDFSKIEAGHLELEVTPFSLSESVARAMQMLAVRAETQGIDLACRIHPGLPPVVEGDPTRLRQVIVNLAGNAIKFTEQGEVVVQVEPIEPPSSAEEWGAASGTDSADTPGTGNASEVRTLWIRVSVRDTGIGIAADKLETIFQAFTQADASTTRRFGGTGLGLAISARLVQLMDGQLAVESEPGVGTTFQFTLPLRIGDARQAPLDLQTAIQDLAQLPVLVVDDESTNRRVLIELLEYWEMKPTAVNSAQQAMELLCQAAERGEPFRLGLFDMMMPDTDGLMLTEQVRRNPLLKELPVIMLSSMAHGADLERCRRAGISHYLLKPFVHSELLNAILTELDAGPAKPPTEEPPPMPQGNLRILLVEDGVVNQRVATELLGLRGHRVTLAENGREAVEMWHPNRFDLVLMDLQMPEMDGFEATRAIRQREQQSNVRTPIIAMTARVMPDDRRLCVEAGMDGYIAKPVDPDKLDDVLAGYHSPATESIAEPAVATEPADDGHRDDDAAAPTQPLEDGGETVLDLQPMLKRFGGRQAVVLQLADVFFEECPVLLEQLHAAIRDQDGELLHRAAHTLKGTSDLFGGQQLQRLCASMEATNQQQAWTQLAIEVQAIEAAAKRLLGALRQETEGLR